MKNISYLAARRYDAYVIFFETLANANRLRIINALRTVGKSVSAIIAETGLEQTCVSHCLARLERCGFVKAARDGKFRIYSLNTDTIGKIMPLIDAHTRAYCVHLVCENCTTEQRTSSRRLRSSSDHPSQNRASANFAPGQPSRTRKVIKKIAPEVQE